MDYNTEDFVSILFEMLKNFYHSPLMLVIKIFAGIYLLVLVLDIIMMLILRDVPQHLRVGIKGSDIPMISNNKMLKRWKRVKERLVGQNDSQYKVAIIEADAIADEILAGIGYKGANMGEKLEQVGENHLDDHLEALRGAHEIRNRIVHEADFAVDQRMATAVVGVYENFLKYLEFLD